MKVISYVYYYSAFIAKMFQQHRGKAYSLLICHANSQGFELVLHQIPNHKLHCNWVTPARLFYDKADHVTLRVTQEINKTW